MLPFLRRKTTPSEVERLAKILVDQPAKSPFEVFRRAEALNVLAEHGLAASSALPSILRAMIVPVSVDCALVLRVAAAAALWRVGQNWSMAIPTLTWALKDESWGVAPRAVEILSEIGHAAVVPDLVRLAGRRLAHGPFYFERPMFGDEKDDRRPLLAAIAEALGSCGRNRWDGQSYREEARAQLLELAGSHDQRVCEAVEAALASLDVT